MSRLILRAFALALFAAIPPLSNASAHCFVGGRFFPAMLATDDPCVADEMSLPTVQYNSANPRDESTTSRLTSQSASPRILGSPSHLPGPGSGRRPMREPTVRAPMASKIWSQPPSFSC